MSRARPTARECQLINLAQAYKEAVTTRKRKLRKHYEEQIDALTEPTKPKAAAK